MKTKALQSRTRQPEALFERILEKIEGLKNDIVYIDECEILFPHREVMVGHANVDVRGHQQMIATFLDGADGLMTKAVPTREQRPLICLATNLKEEVDLAIMDRAKAVHGGLTFPAQCVDWWSLNTRQFTIREVTALGWLSWAAGHSFRAMGGVAGSMVSREAHQIQGPDGHPGEPACREYMADIFHDAREQLPTLLEAFKRMPRWIWSLSGFVYLYDLFRQRVAPRARL